MKDNTFEVHCPICGMPQDVWGKKDADALKRKMWAKIRRLAHIALVQLEEKLS